MIATSAQSLIIECPHCATRYQLAPDALGAGGRKVLCASCGEAWRASPSEAHARSLSGVLETVVDEASERVMDDALERAAKDRRESSERLLTSERWTEETAAAERSIAEIRAALGQATRPTWVPTPAAQPKAAPVLSKAFKARLAALNRQLPIARLRRGIRTVAALLILALVGGLFVFRVDVVRQFPQMAGYYAGLGLPVNVAGLEFHGLSTELSREGGTQLLRISARIVSVASADVTVPPVIVSLLGNDGGLLYRWSVTPAGRELAPGEFTTLSSQITTPPPGVTAVRLTFADGRSVGDARASVAADNLGVRI